jgi:hypothetical protein
MLGQRGEWIGRLLAGASTAPDIRANGRRAFSSPACEAVIKAVRPTYSDTSHNGNIVLLGMPARLCPRACGVTNHQTVHRYVLC